MPTAIAKPNETSDEVVVSNIKLHLGCGLNVVEGWNNIDASLGVVLSKIPGLYPILKLFLRNARFLDSRWSSKVIFHDLRKPLPYADNSVDVIYSSHVFEHFYRYQQEQVLKDWFRVLRPGGIIRIVVPDLADIIEKYLEAKNKQGDGEPAAEIFNQLMCSHPRDGYEGSMIYKIYKKLDSFQEHRWMHDRESLMRFMELVGFRNIRSFGNQKSAIQDIKEIEHVDHSVESVFIEGVK